MLVQDNDEQLREENLLVIAYPPIPKCVIKEEPRDEDDNAEVIQIIAYPPIPRSALAIKEELTDEHDDVALGIHQVIKLI